MRRDQDSQEWVLADRLVNYADALTAVTFLGVSGLGLAVADPDARSSMALIANWVIASNVFLSVAFSAMLSVLCRWEADLRADLAPAPKARRYSRYLHYARLLVIWVSGAQATAILLAIR